MLELASLATFTLRGRSYDVVTGPARKLARGLPTHKDFPA
jgi:hypothetical protein